MNYSLRNIAIIAHVDHGKTTLIDQLLHQTNSFPKNQKNTSRIMDSNDLEKERGITILAKNCSILYKDTLINIIDTPGHSDFSGEVERVLSMVDGVLILIDAVEGPMPQTRFVSKKALALGLKPIVVISKIDRIGSRSDYVINSTFDLFFKLGATEEQLDFPIVYLSSINGYASLTEKEKTNNMNPLLDTVLKYVPAPNIDSDGPLQLQITSIDYNSYMGKIGIGRITRGAIQSGQSVLYTNGLGENCFNGKINQVLKFSGLSHKLVDKGVAGDIVLINGIENLEIGSTVCSSSILDPLPIFKLDEPTLTMNFLVNTSPLSGQEGKFITSRHIRDFLYKEIKQNIALRISETEEDSVFSVSGRGQLHLTILIENMRRKGYELSISKPNVILREENGRKLEPYEYLIIDIEENTQGPIMEELGKRKAKLLNMSMQNTNQVRLEYSIPSRGLIGFQYIFLIKTHGTGLMSHSFDFYGEILHESVYERNNGVLISQETGKAAAYALWKLQNRGYIFINPGDTVYEGMIIGIHHRDNDLMVNPIKCKQLTNVRASGTDEAIRLIPPINLSLEYAVEFISDDELVEVTPKSIRIRKRYLKEHERKKYSKD